MYKKRGANKLAGSKTVIFISLAVILIVSLVVFLKFNSSEIVFSDSDDLFFFTHKTCSDTVNFEQIKCKAVISNDISICDELTEEYTKSSCSSLTNLASAFRSNNPASCIDLENEYLSACNTVFSNDLSICDKENRVLEVNGFNVTTVEEFEFCKSAGKFSELIKSKNPDFCEDKNSVFCLALTKNNINLCSETNLYDECITTKPLELGFGTDLLTRINEKLQLCLNKKTDLDKISCIDNLEKRR